MAIADFIEISCNHCGRNMRVKRTVLMKRGLCNYCGKKMEFPPELQNMLKTCDLSATGANATTDVECPVCSRHVQMNTSNAGQLTACFYCRCLYLVPKESGIALIGISPDLPKLTQPQPLPMACPDCNQQSVATSDEFGLNGACLECGLKIKCHDYHLVDVIAVPCALAHSTLGKIPGKLPVQMLAHRWSLGQIVYVEAKFLIDVLSTLQRFQNSPRSCFSPFSAQWTSDFISRTFLYRLSDIASRREGALHLTLKPFRNLVLQCVFSNNDEGCLMNILRQVRDQMFQPVPVDLHDELYIGLQTAFEQSVIQEYAYKSLFSASSGTGELASTKAIVRRLIETCGLSNEEATQLAPSFKPAPTIDLSLFRIYQ